MMTVKFRNDELKKLLQKLSLLRKMFCKTEHRHNKNQNVGYILCIIFFIYLEKFVGYALHDLHVLTARHWFKH